MSDPSGFELEEDASPTPTPPPTPVPPRAAPAPPPTASAAGTPGRAEDEPLVGARRKARLLRLVPGFAVGFLLVGWICLGAHALPFAFTGAAMGAWAAWHRRGEALLGGAAAVVGLATFFLVAGLRPGMGMGIAIVGCGIVGFVAGLDDRLRGA